MTYRVSVQRLRARVTPEPRPAARVRVGSRAADAADLRRGAAAAPRSRAYRARRRVRVGLVTHVRAAVRPELEVAVELLAHELGDGPVDRLAHEVADELLDLPFRSATARATSSSMAASRPQPATRVGESPLVARGLRDGGLLLRRSGEVAASRMRASSSAGRSQPSSEQSPGQRGRPHGRSTGTRRRRDARRVP
jgi:hypothetical protein